MNIKAISAIDNFIRNTDRTEDEYIQAYLQGLEDALQIIKDRSEE